MRWLRLATMLVKPVTALVGAIREARRESIRKRIAEEKERQRAADMAMLERLLREKLEREGRR